MRPEQQRSCRSKNAMARPVPKLITPCKDPFDLSDFGENYFGIKLACNMMALHYFPATRRPPEVVAAGPLP
jgi:hypothetical protein